MRTLSVPVVALACGVLLSSCSSADKGFGESAEVVRSDLGPAWPLTVDSALLTCSRTGAVSVTVDGRTTLIDLDTDSRDVSGQFTQTWADDPSHTAGRADLRPLLEHGRALCG